MAIYEIPLTPEPQTFSTQLAGVMYKFTVRWNTVNSVWTIDIADENGNKILSGIPLVTGVDLLGQYGYLNFGGTLTVTTDGNSGAVPTYDNLGSHSHLLFTVV